MHSSLVHQCRRYVNDDQKTGSLQHVQGWCPGDLADVITGPAEPALSCLGLGKDAAWPACALIQGSERGAQRPNDSPSLENETPRVSSLRRSPSFAPFVDIPYILFMVCSSFLLHS